MRGFAVLVAAVVLALGAVAAGAYPTLGGATGLVALPTAEVAPAGTVDLAVDYQKTVARVSDIYEADVTFWPARIAAGIGQNLELWAGYSKIEVDESGFDDQKLWNGGVKLALPGESADKVALAIGGSLGKLETDEDDIDLTSAFLVATQRFAMEGSKGYTKASLGLMWIQAGDPIDESLLKPFAGVEFVGESGASLGLEYRVKDDDLDAKAVFSAVVRYPLAGAGSPLWMEAGMTNAALGGLGGDDSDIFVGLGYRFGLPKK